MTGNPYSAASGYHGCEALSDARILGPGRVRSHGRHNRLRHLRYPYGRVAERLFRC